MKGKSNVIEISNVNAFLNAAIINYPEAGHDPEGKAFSLLEQMYFASLKKRNVTPSELSLIGSMALERCRYFPKIPDLLSNLDEVRKESRRKRDREKDRFLIPNTDHEKRLGKFNKEAMVILGKQINGDLSEAQAEQELKACAVKHGVSEK